MKNKIIPILAVLVIMVAFWVFLSSSKDSVTPSIPDTNTISSTTLVYKNVAYGFDFTLPTDWQGYSIIKETWNGTALVGTSTPSGPKLLIRNPKWTESAPYEDLPILIFTISQWEAYTAETFAVSAAPIKATELARNNAYVFALPPRWDFDYSLEYKEAQDIMATNPLQPFDIAL